MYLVFFHLLQHAKSILWGCFTGVQFLQLGAIKKLDNLAPVYSDKSNAPGNLSLCSMAPIYTDSRMM